MILSLFSCRDAFRMSDGGGAQGTSTKFCHVCDEAIEKFKGLHYGGQTCTCNSERCWSGFLIAILIVIFTLFLSSSRLQLQGLLQVRLPSGE